MTVNPYQQQAMQQINNMQHQFKDFTHGALASGNTTARMLDHQLTTVRNDIETNKNPITIKKDMETLNRIMRDDQHMQYQNHMQPQTHGVNPGYGQFGQHAANTPTGPVLNQNANTRMQYGLKQLGGTLNQIRQRSSW